MAALNKHQVRASTLPEVIIAMVVILIVFVIAIQIYNNVLHASPSLHEQLVRGLAENYMEKSITEKSYEQEDVMIDSLEFRREVLPFKGYQDVFIMKVNVFQSGKTMGSFQRVFGKKGNGDE
ncbi:PulJ/GspJ family protein [Pedobacter nutrimenti]|uniref:Uncharacterized protein n=1 Tax=Pedobacter nutrimenti TaxID=1241337 RepID=A0A318UML1_9SPHI|nr:hypothetical protein [Pedobacter nutrimenti]PYF76657.1 hypothetical protein B0O44_101128 [Pedobacter nutrimenti]